MYLTYLGRGKRPFLLLLTRGPGQYRAAMRYASLSQCGHFCGGRVLVFGYSLYIEGCYGSNGLAIDCNTDSEFGPHYCTSSIGVKDEAKTALKKKALNRLWESAVPVPDELIQAWNTGGGWNSSGSEGPDMVEWGQKTFLKQRVY